MLSHNFTALFALTIGRFTIIHNITRFFIVTINVTWSRDLSRNCQSVLSRHNKSVRMTVTRPRPSDTDPAPLNGPTGLHWSCRHRLMSPETWDTLDIYGQNNLIHDERREWRDRVMKKVYTESSSFMQVGCITCLVSFSLIHECVNILLPRDVLVRRHILSSSPPGRASMTSYLEL